MTTAPLTIDQLRARRGDVTLIDVRSAGEYAAGHIPGARNIPMEHIDDAVDALRAAAGRGDLAIVCASGNRSRIVCDKLADAGIAAAGVDGGTSAWAGAGHELDRLPGTRAVWAMERQVRLTAGAIVLTGVLADRWRPGTRWVSAAIGAGLVFSAVTNTCGMAAVLSRLPINRPAGHANLVRNTIADLAG